ncbi:sodium-dependent transporter [Halobium palmae]|uniref:Sodium-dependent transporter n=1 Tax=Halobium palmae TaxID=1776492 RepID=A0ABD5S1R6_9EURY
MSERETWATRAGFILAAVGSAVGLGNIWQFPFQTGQNGGAAFLVVYLLAVVLIGFPAMLAEFVVGRGAERNPIDAFSKLGHGNWAVVGVLGAATAFWILSFYSVVGGWVIRYLLASLAEGTGLLTGLVGTYFTTAAGDYFGAIASGPDAILLHFVFMAITAGVVALGINDGIETATKLMVPSIVVLLLGLGVWAATLSGAGAGYGYYLSPDIGAIAANWTSILPAAVGQAFFTLSLGMGAMITYASYLGEDDSLPMDGGLIVVLNTLVGVLAGFVVFPILFAQGIDPAEAGGGGSGAVFVVLASAFAELPLGWLLGTVFFFVLLLAALSSAISLIEVMVSYVTDHYDVSRAPAAAGLGLSIFLLGVPTALDTATLTLYNDLAYNVLLPLSVLGVLVFVVWVNVGSSLDELRLGTAAGDGFAAAWLWHARVVTFTGVFLALVFGVMQQLGFSPAELLSSVF